MESKFKVITTEKINSAKFFIKMSRAVDSLQSKYGLPAPKRQIAADYFVPAEFASIWDNVLSFKGDLKEDSPIVSSDTQLLPTFTRKFRPRLRTIPILFYSSRPPKKRHMSTPLKPCILKSSTSKHDSLDESSGYDESSAGEYDCDDVDSLFTENCLYG